MRERWCQAAEGLCTARDKDRERERKREPLSIDLLELMHKKAFNRRRLSSPTISDDYPIAILKEVQKSRRRNDI